MEKLPLELIGGRKILIDKKVIENKFNLLRIYTEDERIDELEKETINYIITIFMFLHWGQLYAQNEEREFNIGFRVNEFHVVPTFADNKKEIDSLLLFLHRIQTDSAQYFINVIFRGAASPEGSFQLNKMLSLQRMNALEKIVRGKIDISETMVERDDSYIPWDHLKSRVEKVNMPYKDSVISILDNEPILVEYNNGKLIDQRIVKLREIENGKVWLQLFKNYFVDMRNASVKFIIYPTVSCQHCLFLLCAT